MTIDQLQMQTSLQMPKRVDGNSQKPDGMIYISVNIHVDRICPGQTLRASNALIFEMFSPFLP